MHRCGSRVRSRDFQHNFRFPAGAVYHDNEQLGNFKFLLLFDANNVTYNRKYCPYLKLAVRTDGRTETPRSGQAQTTSRNKSPLCIFCTHDLGEGFDRRHVDAPPLGILRDHAEDGELRADRLPAAGRGADEHVVVAVVERVEH